MYGNYTGQYYYNASELDIDHFFLKNAHQSGGYNWSSKKEEFANYRLDPDNLIAVNLSANRSKGYKLTNGSHLTLNTGVNIYQLDWIRIKDYWILTASVSRLWDALAFNVENQQVLLIIFEEEPVMSYSNYNYYNHINTTTMPVLNQTTLEIPKIYFSNYSEAKTWFDTYYLLW